jgi:hypothetical protein
MTNTVFPMFQTQYTYPRFLISKPNTEISSLKMSLQGGSASVPVTIKNNNATLYNNFLKFEFHMYWDRKVSRPFLVCIVQDINAY